MARTKHRRTTKKHHAAPARHMVRRRKRNPRARRSYGMIPMRKNFFPALLALPLGTIALWSMGIFGAYKVYSTTSAFVDTITRPTVLIGSGVGLAYGYKSSDSMFARLAYMAAGAGAGMLLDRFLFPEEQAD